jgi:hypothetical protein
MRFVLIAMSAVLLAGCRDIETFFARMSSKADNAASSAMVGPDMDSLCALAAKADLDADRQARFDALMAKWEPRTTPGDNVKEALKVVSADQRYEAARSAVDDPDWSCPALERALK